MEVAESSCMEEVLYRYPERYQLAEMMVLGFLGFLIPFTLGHPQLLVGVAVNALLIRSALTLPSYKTIPIILAPAVGAIARGMVLGPFTFFLVYMLPFIWIGNYILVYAFKLKLKRNLNYGLTFLGASLLKAGFLYAAAFVLYRASLIPQALLPAMGMLQLTTALIGGVAAYGFILLKK
jgi:hypothetical protein